MKSTDLGLAAGEAAALLNELTFDEETTNKWTTVTIKLWMVYGFIKFMPAFLTWFENWIEDFTSFDHPGGYQEKDLYI